MSDKPDKNLYREGKHRIETILDDTEYAQLRMLAGVRDWTHSKTIAALIMGRIKA